MDKTLKGCGPVHHSYPSSSEILKPWSFTLTPFDHRHGVSPRHATVLTSSYILAALVYEELVWLHEY